LSSGLDDEFHLLLNTFCQQRACLFTLNLLPDCQNANGNLYAAYCLIALYGFSLSFLLFLLAGQGGGNMVEANAMVQLLSSVASTVGTASIKQMHTTIQEVRCS
jgi:hypothetical protein